MVPGVADVMDRRRVLVEADRVGSWVVPAHRARRAAAGEDLSGGGGVLDPELLHCPVHRHVPVPGGRREVVDPVAPPGEQVDLQSAGAVHVQATGQSRGVLVRAPPRCLQLEHGSPERLLDGVHQRERAPRRDHPVAAGAGPLDQDLGVEAQDLELARAVGPAADLLRQLLQSLPDPRPDTEQRQVLPLDEGRHRHRRGRGLGQRDGERARRGVPGRPGDSRRRIERRRVEGRIERCRVRGHEPERRDRGPRALVERHPDHPLYGEPRLDGPLHERSGERGRGERARRRGDGLGSGGTPGRSRSATPRASGSGSHGGTSCSCGATGASPPASWAPSRAAISANVAASPRSRPVAGSSRTPCSSAPCTLVRGGARCRSTGVAVTASSREGSVFALRRTTRCSVSPADARGSSLRRTTAGAGTGSKRR